MPTPDDYANNQPGLLQRGPTSLLPPIPPSQNDNDPTKTQEAAVPRVPPPTPREDRAPNPGDVRPPAAPFTPVPWHTQQQPPAPPTPPLGSWTNDQIAPWLHPHIPTVPGPLVPDRQPDGYKGPQPVYNLRPGEAGYTAGGNSNLLTGIVSRLETGGGGPFGDPATYGQKALFIAQYGPGPQGVTNYANQLLRNDPNATLGDFYAGYVLGTGNPARPPTIEDLRTRYPEAYRNLVTHVGGELPLPGGAAAQPAGPQGPWTQDNLLPNFAERTGALGQPGNIPLTTVTSPNGQSWQVNQRIAPQFQGFLSDLYKAGYKGMVSSGGYSNRPIRGGTIPSEHAYGAAIDIGAAANPLQYVSAGGHLRTDLPSNVGEIAAKWGLKWGGTFRDRQDPMHFEVAAIMTPDQLKAAQSGITTTTSGGPPSAAPATLSRININTPLASLLGGTVAGPPQQYIPSQPREPQHWGSEPEHDWTPGRMPQAHDIPNILMGLVPLILAGALGGGGMGMLAAYSGYQNARNKGQTAAARDQKNYWKDALEENTSRLKLQMIGAKGILAEYGDLNDPRAKSALLELAMRTDDQQLTTAIQGGDMKKVGDLLNTRDKIFQDLSKTSAAQTKQDEQEAQKRSDVGVERAPYTDQPGADAGGAPGGAEPAAAPSGPRPFFPGSAGGGPSAGTGGRPAPPVAAPAPTEQPAEQPAPPTEAEPQPPVVAPGVDGQPRPQPAAGGQPQPTAPAQPSPATLPDVDVGGLPPADPRQQRITGLSPERLDQDARQYLETQKDPYRGGPSGDPLAVARNETVRRRAAQMQSYIDHVIATAKPGDIEGALQKIDTVDPGLASVARLVDRGDQAPPGGWQLRVPFYQTINKLVTSLDPTWSAARWVTNYRTQVAFSSGTQSTQVASMNRALQHMTVLYDAAKRLPNQGWTDLNGLRNTVLTHLGSDAATNFMEARAAVARELERAFRGGSGAYAEIKADLDNVSSSGSPEQILGYIRTSAELLKGQLDAMADLYQRGTHKATTGDDLLSPEARTSLERIMKWPIDKVPEGQPPPAELDNTATPPPSNMSGPGPAPVEMPQGWVEQPQQ